MNLSTLIIFIILVGIVAMIIRSMIRGKRNGQSTCGGQCGCCGSQSLCHDTKLLFEEYREGK